MGRFICPFISELNVGVVNIKTLFRADLTRVCKSKFTWISVLLICLLAIMGAFSAVTSGAIHIETIEEDLGTAYWEIAVASPLMSIMPADLIIALCIAVFTAFLIGTDFSDKTIRNKVVCGYSKKHIFLSYMLVSFLYAIFLCLIYLIIMLATFAFLCFSHTLYVKDVIKCFASILPRFISGAIGLAAIILLVCFIVRSRRKAVVVSIIVALALYGIDVGLVMSHFVEPLNDYLFDESGMLVLDEDGENILVPNEYRLSDTEYATSAIISRINPYSQLSGMTNYFLKAAENDKFVYYGLLDWYPDINVYQLYPLVWVAVSVAGCLVLSKKEDLF